MTVVTGGTLVEIDVSVGNLQLIVADLKIATPANAPSSTTFTLFSATSGLTYLFTGTGLGSYVNGYPTTGTITGYTETFSGQLIASITSTSISALTLSNLIAANDYLGVRDLLFSGADTLTGTTFSDDLYGYGGNDTLDGAGDNDTLDGGAGNDTLIGGAGNDIVAGGDGSDLIVRFFPGSDGVDTIDGGLGTDVIQFGFSTSASVLNISLASLGSSGTLPGGSTYQNIEAFYLVGGTANDVLTGSALLDLIIPGDGVDTLDGGAGNDVVRIDSVSAGETWGGGSGTDMLELTFSGGGGLIVSIDYSFYNATLTSFERVSFASVPNSSLLGAYAHFDIAQLGAGLANNASFVGGAAPDHIVFRLPDAGGTFSLAGTAFTYENWTDSDVVEMRAPGSSTAAFVVTGSSGNDRLSGALGNDTLSGGDGNDTFSGNDGNDILNGGNGDDGLSGGAGNDWMDGGAGNDIFTGGAGGVNNLIGGTGTDTLSLSSSSAALFVDLSAGAYAYAGGGWDALTSIEGIIGGTGNDVLLGDAADNIILGGNGNDTLQGRDANDILSGGGGNDWLDGGNGNDTLEGGAGVNVLIGGAGVDLASYASQTGNLWVDMVAGVYSAGSVWDVFFDSIDGVLGGTGNDSIFGNGSDNTLNGANGNDSLIGNAGSDILMGGAGSDWIVAGDGNDRLIGGDGVDVLTGGIGNDIFDLGAAAVWDVAFDFNTSQDSFYLGGLSWLGFLTVDADGDGQVDDTLLGYAGGNFVALNVSGLTLGQWNALVTAGPLSGEDGADKAPADSDPQVRPVSPDTLFADGLDRDLLATFFGRFDLGPDPGFGTFSPHHPSIRDLAPPDWSPMMS